MQEAAVRAEVDRYIAWPGQAPGYLVGQREILRLRERSKQRLGPAFQLQDFHRAVLDHGHLPLPALQRVVGRWADTATRTD